MAEKNGKATIIKIITITVPIVLAFTGYLVASDKASRARDITNERGCMTRSTDLERRVDDKFDKIILALGRIEGKID